MGNPIVLIPKRKMLSSGNQGGTAFNLDKTLSYINEFIEDKLHKLTLLTDYDFATHVADTSTHGVAGAIVGTTDTQVLTNKTLTAPTINNGTVSAPTLVLKVTDTDGTTEGELWYDNSEDKLKFKTSAGVATVTSA